jgi:hypothetical protein
LYLLDESLHQHHRHRAHRRSPRPATMPTEAPAPTPSRRLAAYIVCPDAELKTPSSSSRPCLHSCRSGTTTRPACPAPSRNSLDLFLLRLDIP